MLLKNLRALFSQKGQNDSPQYKAAHNAPKQDRSFQKVVGSVQKDSAVPLSLQNKWTNQPNKQTKEIRHFQNKHTHTYVHLAVNTKIWAKHSTIGTGLKERVTSLLQDFLFTVLGSFPQITRSTGQVLQLLWKWVIDFLFSFKILSFFFIPDVFCCCLSEVYWVAQEWTEKKYVLIVCQGIAGAGRFQYQKEGEKEMPK